MLAANENFLSLKEDISFIESYALAMYACLLIQIGLHMNLFIVANLCPMNICGMMSFGGLLSEQLPCFHPE